MVGGPSVAVSRRPGRRRVCRAGLARPVGIGGRPGPSVDPGRGIGGGGHRSPPPQSDRDRLGGSDHPRRRRPTGRRSGSCGPCCAARSSGASCSPSRVPGSDLAGLSTRAERDGDDWIVDGQKVWTTWAGEADYGILLARTDPAAAKHRGISYFICPMRQSGIEVRPIKEMTGRRHFTRCSSWGPHPGQPPGRRRESGLAPSPRSPSATSGYRYRPAVSCGAWARPPQRCSIDLRGGSTQIGRDRAASIRIEEKILRSARLSGRVEFDRGDDLRA